MPKLERGCDPAHAVRAILAVPDDALDYARAKLALDALVDPTVDVTAIAATIDEMTDMAARMCGPDAQDGARLAAVQRLIYQAGPWNGGRPFAYDHGDSEGTRIPNKLLHVYLRRRLGNCVSMPALFLILADRLGLDVALATAPLHIFVRYRLPDGEAVNLETTSGAHPARLAWYRAHFPMSDRALASGLYMRALTKREGVALMATTLLEHLLAAGRPAEAIAVADAILEVDPRAGQVMVAAATACADLLRTEFEQVYPGPLLIPQAERGRHLLLLQRNRSLFRMAEALGWEPA